MDQPTKHRVSSERRWAVLTDCAIALLLCMVQIFVDPPMLIGERWMTGGGWVQIFLAALAGGWLYGRMYPLKSRNRWRRRTWLLFTCVFFGQLGLGIWVDPRFLMSGQLHLPVPDLILGGAIYRWQLGFMPMLFLVTVLLSGGAWCHQLCYFGALDAWSAGDTYRPSRLSNARRQRIRLGILTLFIGVAGGLRLWGFSPWEATLWGGWRRTIRAWGHSPGILPTKTNDPLFAVLSARDPGLLSERAIPLAIPPDRSMHTLSALHRSLPLWGLNPRRHSTRETRSQLHVVWGVSSPLSPSGFNLSFPRVKNLHRRTSLDVRRDNAVYLFSDVSPHLIRPLKNRLVLPTCDSTNPTNY